MNATTTNYSYDFYLRNIYSSNRYARKAENRSTLLPADLVKADSSAMDKITKQLRNLEYSSDNGTDVLNHAKLFVQTYNNLLESTDKTDAEQVGRLRSQMKTLTKEQKDELESIGITIGSSGKLTLDKETFAKCSPSKIERTLGADSQFVSKLSSMSRKIKRSMQRTAPATKPDSQVDSISAPSGITSSSGSVTGIMSDTGIDVVV